MTRALVASVAFGLLICSGQPAALAGGALIETTAPLADRTEASVKAAVIAAIDRAVRGAAAMGFAWFELRDAQVSGDEVAIQILATDEDPGEATDLAPGDPGIGEDDENHAEENEPALPAPAAHTRI